MDLLVYYYDRARTGWLSVRIIWNSRSWCRWPGFPVGQHYKVTMSECMLSQVGACPDMPLDVARTENNKQTKTISSLRMGPLHFSFIKPGATY